MTPEEIRSSLASTLEATWATATPIAWPNIDFNASLATAWIRPVLLMGDSFLQELGPDGCGQRTGVWKISIFTKPNTGTKTAYTYAVRLEAMVRREIINGVIFDEPSTREVGIENGWFHTMVTAPLWTWVGG